MGEIPPSHQPAVLRFYHHHTALRAAAASTTVAAERSLTAGALYVIHQVVSVNCYLLLQQTPGLHIIEVYFVNSLAHFQ